MSERSHGLQAWVQRLNEAELPALAIVVNDLHRLTREADASVRQLAEVLLRDAALTSKVLRVANSSYYNPSQENIRTISRAIVLIGFESVRLIGLSVSLIDQLLARASREQLQELLARSFHAAVQARNIAGYVLARDQEEVFIAALLHDLGELAIWACGGEQADELVVELARPGIEREEAAQRILGTSFRQLTQGLIRCWNLGDLASLAAASPGSKDPGVRAVNLGTRISRAALDGWDCPAMEALVRHTAVFTGVSEQAALQQIHASADEAIDVAKTFGASRLCDLIPHTDFLHIQVQQEQRKARLLQPDTVLAQRALQELVTMATGGAELERVLDSVLDGLHRGVGLERVMLAVLAEEQTSLRVRRAVGEGTQDWVKSFRLSVERALPADLFSYLLRQRQAIWMGVPASYSLEDLVTDAMRKVLGKGMFFVAPVVAGARPIGVLYADSRCSGRALKHEQFVAFQRFTQLTGRCLEALSKPR